MESVSRDALASVSRDARESVSRDALTSDQDQLECARHEPTKKS